jgi:hypothetical protein
MRDAKRSELINDGGWRSTSIMHMHVTQYNIVTSLLIEIQKALQENLLRKDPLLDSVPLGEVKVCMGALSRSRTHFVRVREELPSHRSSPSSQDPSIVPSITLPD